MRRSTLGPAVALALLVLPPAAVDGMARQASSPGRHGCRTTFSVAQAREQARRDYAGLGRVTLRELRRLGWMERCQRNPAARWFVRRYDRRLDRRHAERVSAAARPFLGPETASWYDDSGTTGCGFHAAYGIATLNGTPCGGRVTLRNAATGSTVVATRDDSGPYVGGRMFDLGAAAKAALGCSDLCSVYWRPGG
jgi:hypothetical protein